MLFWLLATALGVAVSAILGRALLSGPPQGGGGTDPDAALYRAQLDELARDLARGTLAEADAETARIEVARRLLAADRAAGERAETAAAPRAVTLAALALVACTSLAGGLAVYARLGAPGYPDMPIAYRIALAETLRESRPDQAEAAAETARQRPALPAPEAEVAELMARLRDAVAARPDDTQGLRLLARNEAALGNFDAAIAAQQRLLALGDTSKDAEEQATLADLMVLAAGGYVSPEAEAAVRAALALDPASGTARYYLGLMHAQTGRPDLGFGLWRELLEQGPPDAPWVPSVTSQIGRLASLAGVEYTPPESLTAAPGPDAGDIAAAAALSDEDRMAMVRGMVEGLNDRLASQGGSAAEWARLISALGVLGETDRARAIWTEARAVFAASGADLAALDEAARQAGLNE